MRSCEQAKEVLQVRNFGESITSNFHQYCCGCFAVKGGSMYSFKIGQLVLAESVHKRSSQATHCWQLAYHETTSSRIGHHDSKVTAQYLRYYCQERVTCEPTRVARNSLCTLSGCSSSGIPTTRELQAGRKWKKIKKKKLELEGKIQCAWHMKISYYSNSAIPYHTPLPEKDNINETLCLATYYISNSFNAL